MSLWRNDADRRIHERAMHLLSKTSAFPLRWLWAVGDSTDDTEKILRQIAESRPQVTVVRHDSGIVGEDTPLRRRRSGWTASQMFAGLTPGDMYACLHESDLLSPDDVVDKLLSPDPTAGWPIIVLNGRPQFYDTWAFRDPWGRNFHSRTESTKKLEVGSFGSVWVAPACLVKDRVLGNDEAIVDLCRQWRSEGIRMYADPAVVIEQPVGLWSPC